MHTQLSDLNSSQIISSTDQPIENNSDEEMDEQKALANTSPHNMDSHAETRSLKVRCYSCEYTLCIFIALLLTTALFLIYDYRTQERQIGDILTTLTKNGIEFNVNHEQEKNDPIKINRVLWTFYDQNVPIEQKWFKRRMALLAKRAAEDKGFTMVELTESNWRQHLPEKRANMLSLFVDSLRIEKTHDKAKYADLTPEIADKIMKELIMLEILYRNGGVYVDSNVLLTDGIKWLDGIQNSPLINAAVRRKPNIVGFYSPNCSSKPQKQDIEAKEETEKFMVRYPSINSYFMYAVAYSEFIKDMLTQFYQLIQNPITVGDLMRVNNITVTSIDFSKPMKDLFYITSQLTLRKKEQQLSKLNLTTLAIDYYNIITINQNFGPTKLRFMIGNTPPLSLFQRLSYITLPELQQQIGHLHFLVLIDPLTDIISLFQQSFQQNRVLAHSFIAQYILDASFISSTFELKYNKLTIEINKWDKFPKNVWTYFTGFEEESSLLLQFWVEHVRDRAFKSGFSFTILTERNLDKHISMESIKAINEAVNYTKESMFFKSRSELISLAVLSQAGGIWVQPLTILTENLNWVVQTYADFKMWNRLSTIPQVMLNFNPRRGGFYDVVYDLHANNTRVGYNLGFYDNFMCSEARTALINDWFKQYLSNLKTSVQELRNKFETAGIKQYQWSGDNSGEFLMLDTLKCLLAEKQKELQLKKSKNSSVGFYGIWGVNGLMGELKLSGYTNFMGEVESNSFFWRYSQQFFELVVGKIFYPVKLHDDSDYLQEMLKNNYKNLSAVIHNNSLFMRYLYRSTLKIVDNHGMLQLENNAELQPWISLPKIVWVFHSESGDAPLTAQCIKNIQHYSGLSKFQIRLVTASNYDKWLSVVLSKQIEAFLQGLQARASTEKSNLNDHLQNIKEKYILLHLLKEHGGILIYRRTLLLENLHWLNSLERNPFLNRGTKTMPQIFGFFTQGYSSNRDSLKSGRRLVKFPSFDTNFFAAVKEANFLIDLIPEFRKILLEPFKVRQRLSQFSDQPKGLHGKDPYYEAFFLASYFTLQARQQQIEQFHMQILAIDYYSIYSINSRFYSSKLPYYFDGKVSSETVIQHLGGITLNQLQARTGPLHFVTIIPKYEQLNKLVEGIRNNNKSLTILQGCFLHRFVFLNDSSKGVVRNDQKEGQDVNGLEWSELPANVWYYQQNGIEQTNLINQLLVLNNDYAAEADGFTLREINDNNIHDLMSRQDFEQISKILQFQVSLIHKSYLYSLAILSHHGGIFLTSNHLLLDGLRWIRDIAKLQKMLIYNRFGELPDVLMTFNTLMTNSNVWVYDEIAQTKVAKLLNYSMHFIAAVRESNFTRDWLSQLMNQIKLEGTSRQLSECDPDFVRLSKFNKSLLVYDALSCTLFKKQKLLNDTPNSNYKQALAYYQLWSISESNSFDKLQSQFNLQESEDLNTFIWDYPRQTVEVLTGKLGGVLSLTDSSLSKFESKIREWKSSSWGHMQSVAESLRQRVKPELNVNATGEIVLQ